LFTIKHGWTGQFIPANMFAKAAAACWRFCCWLKAIAKLEEELDA